MFAEGRAFGFRDPRPTNRVYPGEVHDTEDVDEERETGDESYHAIRRRAWNVRRKVREEKRADFGHFSVTDHVFVLVKVLRSGGIESSYYAYFDEVYDRSRSQLYRTADLPPGKDRCRCQDK